VLSQLTPKDRLRLMKFVCAFAWTDLKVQREERALISRIVKQLELEPDEVAQVQAWLDVPPPVEDLDPTQIPRAHRQIFVDTIRRVMEADGAVYRREWETMSLFTDLLDA
jgi:uncharacterized tellurite resistance protein B-like protein